MSNQEQTIRRYLLGELPDSEQVTLEQEYFSDQQLFEQMVQVENDLVDKYARGLLSPSTRDRFEKYYLEHSQRKERAMFAVALAEKIGASKGVQVRTPIATESWWNRLSVSLRGPRIAWGFSIAVLLLAVLAGWFFIETRRLRQELVRFDSERVTREARERDLQQQITNEQLRAQKLSEELSRMQEGVTSPSPSPDRASTLATLILIIGGTRTVDGTPANLQISSGIEQVRVQLKLRENNYVAYQVAIQSADGNGVFTSRKLTAPNNKTNANLSLVIPAQKFTTGDYILTLRGASRTGEFEDVSKSLIHVDKK